MSCQRHQIRGSIVVSISACHAEDPGSIPGGGVSAKLRTKSTLHPHRAGGRADSGAAIAGNVGEGRRELRLRVKRRAAKEQGLENEGRAEVHERILAEVSEHQQR